MLRPCETVHTSHKYNCMSSQTTQPTPPTQPAPTQQKEPTHRVQKFHVPARTYGDPTAVKMPVGAEILEAVFFEGRVNLWAKCPIEADEEERSFQVISDGDDFNDDDCTLIGMAIRPSGSALHVVEIKK